MTYVTNGVTSAKGNLILKGTTLYRFDGKSSISYITSDVTKYNWKYLIKGSTLYRLTEYGFEYVTTGVTELPEN